jgi:hypothetical protein
MIWCLSNHNNFNFKIIRNLNFLVLVFSFHIYYSEIFVHTLLTSKKLFLLQKSVANCKTIYFWNEPKKNYSECYIFISLNFRKFREWRIRRFRSSRVSVQPPETDWVRVRLLPRVRSPSSFVARTQRWSRRRSTSWWNSEIKLNCF